MKAAMIIAAALCASSAAFAGQTVTSASGSEAQSGAAAMGGNNQNVINFPAQPDRINYDGGYRVNNVPSMVAPGLSQSLTGTCVGSVSSAVAVAGFGGSAAKTTPLTECNIRYDAQTISSTTHDLEWVTAELCMSPGMFKADQMRAHPRCPVPKIDPVKVATDGKPAFNDRDLRPDWVANDN